MRTTLTLDDDVARALRNEAERQHKSFKQVINETLRRGLSHSKRSAPRPFRITPHETRLRPGYSDISFNRLADELADEATLHDQ